MAKLKCTGQLPDEVLKNFMDLYIKCPTIFEEMTEAGANVVYKNILRNMKRAFKDTTELEKHLKITKSYRTYTGKYVNTKVAFYGYIRKNDKDYVQHRKAKEGHEYRTGYKGNTKAFSKGVKEATYTYEGVPVPLIVAAREYGTSKGEKRIPFVRPAFNDKAAITAAMLKVQERYIPR